MSAVILYRIDAAKRMHRYYRMEVQPDLFGDWCLMREWGRIGRRGQIRPVPFPTPQKAEAALRRQRSTKERRGYELMQNV
jgi:predicted DNA-binding WGR domain protein